MNAARAQCEAPIPYLGPARAREIESYNIEMAGLVQELQDQNQALQDQNQALQDQNQALQDQLASPVKRRKPSPNPINNMVGLPGSSTALPYTCCLL